MKTVRGMELATGDYHGLLQLKRVVFSQFAEFRCVVTQCMFLCEIVIVIVEVCKKNPIQLYTLRHSLVCAVYMYSIMSKCLSDAI